MVLFKKSIKVNIETSGSLVISKISINGNIISKIQCVLQEDNTLLIGDIIPFKKKAHYSKGYGSMMMDELIKYANENGIKAISGKLSLIDNEHRDRSHAFYKKNGFKIILFNAPKNLYYGEVIRKI